MQEFSWQFPTNKLAQLKVEAALYVVATPIGNLLDISFRALEILSRVDLIICEDSRVTSKILNNFGIKKSFLTYNDQSNQELRDKILAMIKNGQSLALVSDAGTPLISDPGYKLVSFLLDNLAPVIAVPGPSSVTAALSISGIASDRFLFAGFIPNTKESRHKFFVELLNINASLIFFESANRLVESLELMLEIFGNRKAAVVREISKIYEETKKDQLINLLQYYQNQLINGHSIKGEIVILISKTDLKDQKIDQKIIEQEIRNGLHKMKPKDLIKLISDQYGIDKKSLYQTMLKILAEDKKN